ncbi:MAG: hypothetical protein PHW57_01395, partial [Candidatus Shapirobacteria bacterium]|nr:hypothetical protein [Candidatus Shapirobacteria bacterium]
RFSLGLLAHASENSLKVPNRQDSKDNRAVTTPTNTARKRLVSSSILAGAILLLLDFFSKEFYNLITLSQKGG